MQIDNMQFPLDRKYHRSHLWVKQEGDNLRIGIDAFLTSRAGYINFLTIDAENVAAGESFGSIESGKFVSKVYSPANGRIVNINQEIVNNPRRINDDPYSAWIVEISPGEGGAEPLLESEQEISTIG